MPNLEEKLSDELKPNKKEWIPFYGPLQAIIDRIKRQPSYLGPGRVNEDTVIWNMYHSFATGFPASYLYFLLN